jgi:PadR family transcriptional regulator, regulatory protein PadR
MKKMDNSDDPRLTHQTLKVLRAFMEKPNVGLAGSDIWKDTRMFSGTLYPTLLRLEKAGWLESSWEEIEPKEAGRPRKRLYRLTGVGYAKTRTAFRELEFTPGVPSWA